MGKLYFFSAVLLLFSLLLDIGGGFGIKYAALAIATTLAIHKLIFGKMYRAFWLEAALISFFVIAALLSILRGEPIELVFSDVAFIGFFVLAILLKDVSPDRIQRLFIYLTSAAAVIVIVTFMLIDYDNNIGLWMGVVASEFRLGHVGLKPGFEGVPNVYYRWSVWLLLGCILLLYVERYKAALLLIVSIVLTMSAALIGALLILLLYYLAFGMRLSQNSLQKIGFLMLVAVLALSASILAAPEIVDHVIYKYLGQSQSTITKVGHIASILDILSSSATTFLFGQGPGTSFYSEGAGEIVRIVEVSHFNVLRQYGILGGLILTGYVAYVMFQLTKLGRAGHPWAVGLGIMFLVAGTNPLLLSPMFVVPLIMGRMFALEYRRSYSYAS